MKMKRILINATQPEELRVAIVITDGQNQILSDLLIERPIREKTGNVYLGVVTAKEDSLNACFVNYGAERHGFLPFKEISLNLLPQDAARGHHPQVKDLLREGQQLIVQVEKEERGNKGAALTCTNIGLAGSFLVLMPNNPRVGGISRRVEGDDRDGLREILSNLPVPEGMGIIIRTAGVGKELAELQWDLNILLHQWEAIQKAAHERSAPFLIHQESDVLIRAMRDYLREDVSEIIVDDIQVFERIKTHLTHVRPDFVPRLKLYNNPTPLFSRYQVEHQIEATHSRDIRLPSGASIVIEHTEALVTIDVNSGQATKGKDIEETAFEINKEAAGVIACQLRTRDIGGLIVIDFIDMVSAAHRRRVEEVLQEGLKPDKAKTQMGTISPRFGLLIMSRQRLAQSVGEATRLVCPRCDGWGSLRSVESFSLSILRIIQEYAIRPGTSQIQVQLPVDVTTFIINEKRNLIVSIEKTQKIQILILPNPKLESPQYRIKRIMQRDGVETEEEGGTGTGGHALSYRLVEPEAVEMTYPSKGNKIHATDEVPAVKDIITHHAPAPSKQQGRRDVSKKPFSLIPQILKNLLGIPPENKNKEGVISSSQGEHKKEFLEGTRTKTSYKSRLPHDRPAHKHVGSHHGGGTSSRRSVRGTGHLSAAKGAKPNEVSSVGGSPLPPISPPERNERVVSRTRTISKHSTKSGRPSPTRSHSPLPVSSLGGKESVPPTSPENYLEPTVAPAELEEYYRTHAGRSEGTPSIKGPHLPKVNTRSKRVPNPVRNRTKPSPATLESSTQPIPPVKRSSGSSGEPSNRSQSAVEESGKGASEAEPLTGKENIAPKGVASPAKPSLKRKAASGETPSTNEHSEEKAEKLWIPHKVASAPSPSPSPASTASKESASAADVEKNPTDKE